ncbi:hypothetical protein GOV04_00815 [Candidatus Woesearchaeota archaeon]|nr:hypothetical protein [Candidatus Woesearchaeota archaeon]
MGAEYKTKSIIVSRKKTGEEIYNALVALYDANNPQYNSKAADKILEFENISKILLKNLNVQYLLVGNDLVINNLSQIIIEQNDDELIISAV